MGSACFEIKQKQAKDVSDLLLTDGKSTWTCLAEELPTILLVDLFVASNVRKIVLQSDEHVPQQIQISYSMTGKKNSFRMLKVIEKSMKRGVPFIIDLKTPVKAKYFRIRVIKGTKQVSLCKIEIFGSPLITPENLANIEYSKALSTIYEKAKNMVS